VCRGSAFVSIWREARVVSVDLDPKALEANNLSESDVVTAMSMVLNFPERTAKIGGKEVPIHPF